MKAQTIMAISLKWVKLQNGNWANLETVNLTNVMTFGVYIIWNSDKKVVRVGQGNVSDRLSSHRNDNEILSQKGGTLFGGGTLYVTWASVSSPLVDGVERYLYDHYSPIVGERAPAALPIAVNAP